MASISYNSVRGLHGTLIYGPIADINQFTTTCYAILQSSKELQWINFNPLFKNKASSMLKSYYSVFKIYELLSWLKII